MWTHYIHLTIFILNNLGMGHAKVEKHRHTIVFVGIIIIVSSFKSN